MKDLVVGNKTLSKDKENLIEATLLVKTIWRNCDAVCLDVDSTVCCDEAIDELARFLGKAEQVQAVTCRAMNGKMSFRQALRDRLDIIRPSYSQLEQYKKEHPPKLTAHIRELVCTLQNNNVEVYLVSGGFKAIITPVAKQLNIPIQNIFANVILFKEDGTYNGFDLNQPTSESGGKGVVCSLLKQNCSYRNLVIIGDGATDMEACPPADAFIGFGGNQVRDSVKSKSAWYVTNFEDLRNEFLSDKQR